MKKSWIAGGAIATVFALLAIAVGRENREVSEAPPVLPTAPNTTEPAAAAATGTLSASTETGAPEASQGFLYGRVTGDDGATYEGRLRFGAVEEAFWSDYFNGLKPGNKWATYVPADRMPKVPDNVEIFGMVIVPGEREVDLERYFMARFGEIARIDKSGRDVHVTLKSGTDFVLDLFEASDFDDGVRVWDTARGVVDLGPREIRSIEFLPTPVLGSLPERLHGTVRTARGDFTGFVQWNRTDSAGTDELEGRAAEGEVELRFDTIASIARRSHDSSLVTLRDGREIVLSKNREVGEENLGVYVDDRRFGRVLVSWGAFERIDFSAPGSGEPASGPGYGDFPPGRPLTGSVTTRDGRRLAGRLVYDLDESESTETFDAPAHGVDYTLPFGLVAAIDLSRRDDPEAALATVTLQSGEELELELDGDLGLQNAGLLVFVEGSERPAYVSWPEVARVDLDGPLAISPPLPRAHGQ